MPQLNFNALASSGPQGFYKGFEQGQKEKVTSEIDQIKLEELKRDRDEMVQLQEKLKGLGQDPDVGKYLDAIAATGKPEYVKMAIEGRQKLKDLDAYAKLGVLEPAGTSPAMPTGAPAPVNALAPAPVVSGALGSGTFDPSAPAVPAAATVPVNALAPAPVTAPAAPMPVNALAPQPGADQIAPTQQRIRQLLDFARTNPRMATQAMAEAKILQDQLELYSKRGPTDSAEVQTMRAMGFPLTQAGYQAFRDAQQKAPAPASVPSMVGEYQFAKTPEGGGYVGSYEKFVRDRAVAARPPGAPAQPVAPTITQIVDPTDSSKMITVDARRYQGGGAGSPGVIGVAGKEPSAALRTNKVEAGKTQLADDLDNLRASFQTLNTMRAIPSTGRGVISNIGSATAATGLGQMLGRAGGTEAQVERDVINSARMRLVNSIKNATGMSAQQLNSNVELQTMLKSISDPGQSVEAAMRIIDDIENAYVKGDGKLPKRGTPAAPAAGGATGGWGKAEVESK